MNLRSITQWTAGLAVGVALIALALGTLLGRSKAEFDGFLGAVDVRPLDRSAVWHNGRLKSYESFANEYVTEVAGRGGIHVRVPSETAEDGVALQKLPADVALLDLLIRPERYEQKDLIYVKKKPMRAELATALQRAGAIDEARAERIIETGQIAVPLLRSPAGAGTLERWSRDLIRTAKHADRIYGSLFLAQRETINRRLALVPPPSGDPRVPWISTADLWPNEDTPPIVAEQVAQLPPETRDALRGWWGELTEAWRAEDAQRVNTAVAGFASTVSGIAPELYPSQTRLGFESLYFQAYSFVWGWIVYLFAVVFLLMSTAFKWDWARRVGLGTFLVAVLLHTAALGLRWYVSGRWPNSNMFEAVTTSVWFGVVIAIGLEVVARRTPLRNLFAIGGGVASMAAMMSAQFVDELDPSINNMMPILHDLWLYIHTNTIIASYALIAMAAATAGLYLIRRFFGGDPGYARVGGTGLLLETATGETTEKRLTASAVLDGATLVMMELSFVMLWAGIVMGAIWADHSWGRPWGWDPKEVFALNTFIVFVVLIHVRLKSADKGLWTAVLAVIGCGVMLFNWIVINFVISGLHSYA